MKTSLYSIYDKQAEIYGRPFHAVNDILAKRTYETIAQDPKSDLALYPQDYKLVKIGTFDSKSGELTYEKSSLDS